jgi:hypothetical protein
MPELAHEIPSDEELAACLREHWKRAAPELYERSPGDLHRIMAREYADAFLSLAELDGREFARRSWDAVFAVAQRLNALSRDHEFWRNTNRRPTYYKLSEFCSLVSSANPQDAGALWALGVLPVWHGSNDFGQEAWLALSHLPEFDIRWPIYAAITTDLNANETAAQTVEFLRASHAEEKAGPILQQIAQQAVGPAADWAVAVITRLAAS